jgi:uncharacterized metal-binding protein YceD (DUF177 family)
MEQGWMKVGGPLDGGEMRRFVIRLLKQLQCVGCGQVFNPRDFALVHQLEEMWILSTRCRRCEELTHVVIAVHLEEELEPLTDLTLEELSSEDEWTPITTDDVLDVHALLQDFDGDFEALLAV